MDKEEYLNIVLEQVRNKRAKEMICEEIGNHIDDQANAYIDMGIEEEKAMEMSVEEMGDPVDTGVSLDRIHRPKMEWKLLILIAIISMISIVVQFAIYQENTSEGTYYLFHQLFYISIGFGAMLITYYIDYSMIGKFAKEIAVVFSLYLFVCIFFTGEEVNGAVSYTLIFNRIAISLSALVYLYVPIYGAILYQYRGEGYKAFIKSLIWLMPPVLLAYSMPSKSLALQLFLILLLVLSVGVVKSWFIINKKIVLLSMWGLVFLVPFIVAMLVINGMTAFLNAYQISRIKVFLDPMSSGLSYQIENVRELVRASNMLGINNSKMQTGHLSYVNSDYILTYIISTYGILFAVLLLLILGALIRKIFKISFMQKNQLGMIMGCACGLVYSIQVLTYVLQNIGLFPTTATIFLPLFSFGATGTIVSYILLGILLSIYRYQSIISTKVAKRRRIKLLFVEE